MIANDKQLTPESKPPIRPEDWLAFVIAAQGYKARSEAEQSFGKSLIERYTVALPKRYEQDPVATAYFDAMLCHVASAIRGMSVVSTSFGTKWKEIEAIRKADSDALERFQRFGPLSADSYWVKAAGLLPGAAVAGLVAILKGWTDKVNLRLGILVISGAVLGFIAAQAIAEILLAKKRRSVAGSLTTEVDKTWQTDIFDGYQAVGLQFLRNAYEVTARFYGAEIWSTPLDETLAHTVKESFALRKSRGH